MKTGIFLLLIFKKAAYGYQVCNFNGCTMLLDIDQLGKWTRKWGMRFQPVKCKIIQLTRKQIKQINAVYSFEGRVLENVDNIKYLGVTISKDLKWNTHVSNICTKANRTLGFLRRNLLSCPQDVKETAYKGLVWPVLEYASPVWDSYGIVVHEELEKVQNRAARFVTGNGYWTTLPLTKSDVCSLFIVHVSLHMKNGSLASYWVPSKNLNCNEVQADLFPWSLFNSVLFSSDLFFFFLFTPTFIV